MKKLFLFLMIAGLSTAMIISSCKKEDEDPNKPDPQVLPVVETVSVGNVGLYSANVVVNVKSDGGFPIIAKGVCWAKTSNPDTIQLHTDHGGGTGTFTSAITNLESQTKYYVRGYARNSKGITYGNQLSFTTL